MMIRTIGAVAERARETRALDAAAGAQVLAMHQLVQRLNCKYATKDWRRILLATSKVHSEYDGR
jgi:hypothetical protein